MRFDLIDRILHQSPGSLQAAKNVTAAEEYLADHFPGFPILPGVMMLETLAQAARALLHAQFPHVASQGPLVVSEVRNVRYGNMVRPGQTLIVAVSLRKPQPDADGSWDFQGTGSVNDQVAVQGRFKLAPLPKPQMENTHAHA